MTESAKIAAANNYSRDVAAADAAYNQGVADLNNYVRDQQKAERDEIFNNVMTTIDSQTWNTTADLENYLYGEVGADGKRSGGVVNGLSDFQKAEIENRLNFYKGSPEQQAAEVAHQQAETAQNWANMSVEDARAQFGGAHVGGEGYTVEGISDSHKRGDNFQIVDSDGKWHYVQLAQKIVDTDTYNTGMGNQISMINHFNRLGVEDGGVFTVNGHVYIKIGTDYYEVENRTGAGRGVPTDLVTALNKPKQQQTSAPAQSASAPAQQTSASAQKVEVSRNGNYIYYSDGSRKRYR